MSTRNFTKNLSINTYRRMRRIFSNLVIIFVITDLLFVAESFVSINNNVCPSITRRPFSQRVFGITDKQIVRSRIVLQENPDDNQHNDRIMPSVFQDSGNQTAVEESTDTSYTNPNRNGIKIEDLNGFKVENQATTNEGEIRKSDESNIVKQANGESLLKNGFNGKNGLNKVNGQSAAQVNGFNTTFFNPAMRHEYSNGSDNANGSYEPSDQTTITDVGITLSSAPNGSTDHIAALNGSTDHIADPTTPKKSKKGNLVRDPALFDAVARWSEVRFRSRQDNEGSSDHKAQRNTVNGGDRYFGVLQDGQDLQQLRKDVASALSEDDIQEIEIFWDRMEPTLSYFGNRDEILKVYKALWVAFTAHNGQRRKSGEPFIIHPVEVALLLSGLKMDSCTVCAGLLHDTGKIIT